MLATAQSIRCGVGSSVIIKTREIFVRHSNDAFVFYSFQKLHEYYMIFRSSQSLLVRCDIVVWGDKNLFIVHKGLR